jgi:hypothetical protein
MVVGSKRKPPLAYVYVVAPLNGTIRTVTNMYDSNPMNPAEAKDGYVEVLCRSKPSIALYVMASPQ